VLLDLADTISPRAYALTALPMVQRSMLEKRVMTILSTDRRPTGRQRLLMTTFGFALFTVVISIARPVAFAPRPAQEQETILDPSLRTAGMSPVWAPDGREFWFETTLRIGGGQAGRAQEPSCALDTNHAGSFRGRITASHRGGVTEQVGRHGNDYVIEKTFGDLRACMLAEGVDDQGTADRPSQWIDRARYVVLATASAGRSQRLEVVRAPAGPERVTWTVAGVVRPPDRATEQWRSQLLAVLDTTWEVSSLRGHVSSLRGEISSIFGERSSLQGEISSLGGEVSSMRGEVSSVRGHESSLRGEISSILGHESSLRGAISSEHGAISSLNANRYAADSTERARIAKRIAEHDREIDRIEREIRDYNAAARVAAVEKEIAAYDADGKVAAIEARIKAFDLNRRIADVERRIGALEVEKRTAALDGQIEALDADRRARQLEERRTEEVKRLEGTIQGIR
jgi:predicted  nucleic acid-binding Zn-ribbon protein